MNAKNKCLISDSFGRSPPILVIFIVLRELWQKVVEKESNHQFIGFLVNGGTVDLMSLQFFIQIIKTTRFSQTFFYEIQSMANSSSKLYLNNSKSVLMCPKGPLVGHLIKVCDFPAKTHFQWFHKSLIHLLICDNLHFFVLNIFGEYMLS